MKITSQILSIPPYISTTWANIASLYVLESEATHILVIEQIHGGRVEVAGLEADAIGQIFSAHASSIELASSPVQNLQKPDLSSLALHLPVKMFGEGLEKMGAVLQHNPDASNTPDLPCEILEKIGTIVKTLGLEDGAAIPNPEEGCNCTFCQIARKIHRSVSGGEEPQSAELLAEEVVTEEDLKFRTWDILQKGEQLYEVTNPIDKDEQYNVYLGETIGCTCGHRNCEHVRAVLST